MKRNLAPVVASLLSTIQEAGFKLVAMTCDNIEFIATSPGATETLHPPSVLPEKWEDVIKLISSAGMCEIDLRRENDPLEYWIRLHTDNEPSEIVIDFHNSPELTEIVDKHGDAWENVVWTPTPDAKA